MTQPKLGLWAALPHEIAPLMRPEIPDLAAEMVREIQASVPGYASSAAPDYRLSIQRGVEQALHEFVGRVGRADGVFESAAEVHRAIGRAELRSGRSLDALQAAYRVGARVSWRRWAHIGLLAEASPSQMYSLAEAVFAHIDELASHAVAEYVAARDMADEARRRKLLRMLTTEPAPPLEVMERTARELNWKPPTEAAVVVIDGPQPGTLDLPAEVLGDPHDARPCLLLPDPAAVHDGTLHGWTGQWRARGGLVAVGPAGPLAEASSSLRLARQALELVEAGAIARPDDGFIHCTDHVATLVLLRDEAVVGLLLRKYLAPLAERSATQQQRMVDTLLAWLTCRGGAPEVARALGVHPQTVRYRMRQAEETFGPRLIRDEGVRLDFAMALRAWQLVHHQG